MQWIPHPGPQTKALQIKAFETLFGGSRGPGKTDAGIVWLAKPYLLQSTRARSLVIRKNAKDLTDWIDRARYLYSRYGAQVVGNPPEIRFPSGYKIRLGHLRNEHAYEMYQGHEYQRMLIEELTQIPQEKYYLQLLGSCRSTVEGIDARVFNTTNPGGVGHGWVKKRFIDPAPWGTKFTDSTGRSRIFIPGRIEDNPTLLGKDPNYILYLDGLKDSDEELWKAWRLGDWDTFAGQYFREFRRELHVYPQFTPNYDNKAVAFIGGMDWGRADPFAFLASLVYKVFPKEGQEFIPFYRVVTFQEVYGTEKRPDEWGEIIENRVKLEAFQWVMADTQIYNPGNDKSVSIFEQFANHNEKFREILKPASKERVNGWEYMHNWLSLAPDGRPYWIITENCVNLIRTLPELVHDETIVEDVDTTGEDHAPDTARYMLKALKWIDAKVGVINQRGKEYQGKMLKTAAMRIDLNQFAISDTNKRDWRTI